MADNNQLNFAWLGDLSNPHHDGTTQQIDDFTQAFVTDNQLFNQRKAAVHQTRQREDEVWLTSQRDDVVPEAAAPETMAVVVTITAPSGMQTEQFRPGYARPELMKN